MENNIAPLLTTAEVAAILKIHPKVVERMAERGEVPAPKVGKFWRYQSRAVDAWITSGLQSDRQACRIQPSFLTEELCRHATCTEV